MFHNFITCFFLNLQRRKIWIAQEHIPNSYNELYEHVWHLKGNKKALTWCCSPLCKDLNFPLHQSHAVNRLPLIHKPFCPHPCPKHSTQPHLETCDTYNWQGRRHRHTEIFLCPEHWPCDHFGWKYFFALSITGKNTVNNFLKNWFTTKYDLIYGYLRNARNV
jgi:hypothetical protein